MAWRSVTTAINARKMLVNLNAITAIEEHKGYAVLILSGGKRVAITEPYRKFVEAYEKGEL